MKILGIETSCDETSVAIIDDSKNILAHKTLSQIDLHQIYGGVVPEIAARSHLEVIDSLILESLKAANLEFSQIDAFAATSGPGLIGGVIVGMTAAKALAAICGKPFLAINHLEGHALTARICTEVKFPFLLLLVSGGHCQILFASGIGNYQKIGETIDDAIGETFDKVAQMLGLGYPGGPAIEKLAKLGNENRFRLTRPLIDSKSHEHLFNFSLSGLKTATRRLIEEISQGDSRSDNSIHSPSSFKVNDQDKFDICASLQKTIADIIINRLNNVAEGCSEVKTWLNSENEEVKIKNISPKNLVICGGVAANRYLFGKIQEWGMRYGIETISPPIALCTDNAAMIAWAGIEKLKLGLVDDLNFKPKARWEL